VFQKQTGASLAKKFHCIYEILSSTTMFTTVRHLLSEPAESVPQPHTLSFVSSAFLPPTPRFPTWSSYFRFPNQTLVRIPHRTNGCYSSRSAHPRPENTVPSKYEGRYASNASFFNCVKCSDG